ncbi:LysM peptidoglycan-binding domain-containing protein [Waterburya agarophytonicola K14]|uniref:LysM peptidoglycan-binding domain-containing protein n=1 Tax=Waterburya agarophytonicola KI4 TaxID=2874699 RepID=A0A964BPA7_9CYAN|nr:LysM domain-containing protein [Waterburya agarophytonicola]MCC0177079.1 LysM peptidoglycan-binding domain-containing protein [Waterburya agarophytonicola KI4]
MSVKLTCPVCDRSLLSEIICPNCETDLSIYKMLAELPGETPIEVAGKKSIISLWLPIIIAILFLLLGLGLGITGKSIVAEQTPQITESYFDFFSSESRVESDGLVMPILAKISPEIRPRNLQFCGGFNYIVRRGDSLSLIADHFYGDRSYLFLIRDANKTLKGRENYLQIGEHLFIPNFREDC